ncbi:ATP-grasp domain-containing protein [Flavobacterium sp. SM15]|uniref:ATP-grasp domain-containing protein n=1 Tax=Flavobacterium sp. SM15 TaxID=2908005 RepID=UPI001EDC016B|nr:ATP-grasp domain-containing protein [Flavobacterium sp. SM15]MCG2611262.1 ATP-grasp domain-containing protein [Flavobacterium sp. SM15]
MERKTVLITGIGGNVGQGILRNIQSLQWPIRVVGCDIAAYTSGNYLCDATYQVPYSYQENYISVVNDIIKKEKIDLVIPSTDYEVYYLALNSEKLAAPAVTCDALMAKTFLDKYATYKCFSENGISFSKSWLPEEFDFSVKQYIAKPREGRGSRGILINPENVKSLGDDYLIQELHQGIEITTAIYVNRQGLIHGIFSMERKLENGTTSQTIVNDKFNAEFLKIAQQIVDLGGIRGSINLQSIVDEHGRISPFEVNGRISGTNSIRHCFGFQDVKYVIQEYLYNQQPDKPVTIKGVASRILLDVIYTNADNFESLKDKSSKHIIY